MLGNVRVRTGLAIAGVLGALIGLAAFGSPADAELVAVRGEAYGIDGEITLPPEVQDGPRETVVIEPEPAVTLPERGSEVPIVESIAPYTVADGFVTATSLSAQTQGGLDEGIVRGLAQSDTLLDDLSILASPELPAGFIRAESIRSLCLQDEVRSEAGVLFEDLFVGDVEIEAQPDPNTELVVEDFGVVRFNAQIEEAGRIEVAALEIEFDVELEGEPLYDGALRLGVAECGTEVIDEEGGRPFVPIADLADPFDGDPSFTG